MFDSLKDRITGKLKKGTRRHKDWKKVRDAFLKKPENQTCALCGGTAKLEVHHIVPVSHPRGKELELDETNLITLCENKKYGIHCHLFIGHLGNYRYANDTVRDDCEYLRFLLRDARARYLERKKTR